MTRRFRCLRKRVEKPVFYIICEGESEYYYMDSLSKYISRSSNVRLHIINKNKTDANNLLKIAKNTNIYSRVEFDPTVDKKFIILDGDKFAKGEAFIDPNKRRVSLEEYKEECKKQSYKRNKYEIIVIDSLIDFEVWIKMHFMLPKDGENFHDKIYKKGKPDQLEKIFLAGGSVSTAISSSMKCTNPNNYSNMHILINEIKKLDKDFENSLIEEESK